MSRKVEEIVLKVSVKSDINPIKNLPKATSAAQKGVDGLGKASKGASGKLKSLNDEFRTANQVRVGRLRKFKQEMKGVGKEATKVKRSMSGLSKVVAGVGFVALAKKAMDVSMAYERIDRSFQTVFGSAEASAAQMEKVRNTANNLGLAVQPLARGFGQLSAASRGTNLEGKETEEIFKGITAASAALGLSADQTGGAIRAIEQMISKGNVQAEELRGQLGERLPGAFQMSARAMGVTTQELNKMLENGEVLAEDLLPKLARQLQTEFGAGAMAGADSRIADMNRMRNAWEKLMAEGGNVITQQAGVITTVLNRVALGLEEFQAQIDQFHGTGVFDPAFDREMKSAVSKEDLLANRTAKQLEAYRIAQLTTEEREAELQALKEQEKAQRAIEGLKSFTDLNIALQLEEKMQSVADKAGLTKEEFQKMKPAIAEAITKNVDMDNIIKTAQATAKNFKEELNGIKTPEFEKAYVSPLQKMIKRATELKKAMDMRKELGLSKKEMERVAPAIAEMLKKNMTSEQIKSQLEGLRELGFFDEENKDKKFNASGSPVSTALQVGTQAATEFLQGNKVLFDQLAVQKLLLAEQKKKRNEVEIITD